MALKEQKICFQTPMIKIRIHWLDGAKIYNSAEEAAKDMRGRGLKVQDKSGTRLPLEEKIQRALPWQRVGKERRTDCGTTTSEDTGWNAGNRAKEKLQEFKR
ncbi:hypothetical protein XENOCAPTIV_022160 [Xenoophorus captivus]|uniref:Uncharacterized protein n=1 Tax=Xenoophorus captivus TaxID=1517983 RepID=A0ABV0S069_9TELE